MLPDGPSSRQQPPSPLKLRGGDAPIARALGRVWLVEENADVGIAVDGCQHAPGDDRRMAVRRDGCGDISVATAPDRPGTGSPCGWIQEHGTSGRLIDLSMTGVSMVLTKSLETGTAILVRLAPHENGHPMDVPAEVVRCRELVDGQWKIVAKFDQHLCFDQAYVMTQSAMV